jgi:hypothetical protein
VHDLLNNNHSFWRGNKIDMHLCCCKKTNFHNRLFSECSPEGANQAFQTTMLFPMAGSAVERRVTDRQTNMTKWIYIYISLKPPKKSISLDVYELLL